ncbi:hypothetical protein F6X40_34780 [Paraburkholderia sp. UCT31]|uniref:hypothetical protein n=1 Tax=Paraburkholderia sp. UCT31 TaxID=2615209 RepID=UPI0016564731|nr:hypothetical protein [Paraburkholderia sp. UCT31]MBC8741728.1 hypothetical protein [Paraburkholderia sp. UCT31]
MMSMGTSIALVNQLKELDDESLARAVTSCRNNLQRLRPFTPEFNECTEVYELVKSRFEIRKAEQGRADLDWEWLLSSIPGAYSFEPSYALGAALKPYGLSVPWPPAYFDKSGQAVLEIKMARDDTTQINRILVGFETLKPFLFSDRDGYDFNLKTSQAKSRPKSFLRVHENGSASIVVQHVGTDYLTFRAALEHVSRELYWEEPPEPAPRIQKQRGRPKTA